MNRNVEASKKKNKRILAYAGLIFVVLMWGINPLFLVELNEQYSPTFRYVVPLFLTVLLYLFICRKRLRELNRDYIKYGLLSGTFIGLGAISQYVGLLYTTPSRFAFLENLSCITVPILLFFFIRKKPSLTVILSCFVCLCSAFILNGVSTGGGGMWGVGEILCSLAGLFYGVNIAVTGAYAKKLYVPMYMLMQFSAQLFMHLTFGLLFSVLPLPGGGGAVIEPIVFTFEPKYFFFLIGSFLLTNALCWGIRTFSMKYVDVNTVAIIMPFSAVITGIASVLMGHEDPTVNLILGGSLGLIAIFLSGYDDIFKKEKGKSEESNTEQKTENKE